MAPKEYELMLAGESSDGAFSLIFNSEIDLINKFIRILLFSKKCLTDFFEFVFHLFSR